MLGVVMKRKIFGIKISTVFTVVLCLVAAVFFWLFAKYSEYVSAYVATAALDYAKGLFVV